jgi:transcriptional regulator with XRE-family HTH domain
MDQNQLQNEAEEIKAAMKEQRLSAAALHRISGVSQNTIGKVLKATSGSEGTLKKLRVALGLQPKTMEAQEVLSKTFPPNVVAVQLMMGHFMLQTPESEWFDIGEEVAAILLAHGRRVSETGE